VKNVTILAWQGFRSSFAVPGRQRSKVADVAFWAVNRVEAMSLIEA
jgi:hypothetical protein